MKQIAAHKNPFINKLLLWVSGFGSYYVFTWLYDYVVVTFCLVYFGFIKGAVIIMILSAIVDLATLKFYDWLKKDWLALETIKNLEKNQGVVGKIFYFVRDKGSILTIIILSLTSNAFVVTTYMRKGSYQYNGMALRDWVVFISS